MKLKNKIIVICLIFFMLISITAVSAENNNSDIITTNNDDNDILSITNLNDNEILSADAGSFADLNKTINGDSSTSILLDKDYSYSSSDTIKKGIVINKGDLTIDGQGHTIDAKGQSRIFYVNSTTVYLKNIKFVNGNSTSGGAIYGYGDNLRVINCTFVDNVAKWGGAVYSYPDSYSVFVNSTFIDNTANYGGAMALLGDQNHARHDVLNCTFIGNKATAEDYDSGGAIYYYADWDSNNYVRGSVFINNTAKRGAGAIYNSINAMINITYSIFIGNSPYQIDSFAYHVYADYNWFGNTFDNISANPNVEPHVEINNWFYMDLIPHMDTSSATISINNLYNNQTGETSTYCTSKLPSIDVDVKAVNANIDVNKVSLDNTGKSELDFALLGDAQLTASYESSKVTKRINSGNFAELQRLINNANDGDVITLQKDYMYVKGVDTITQGIQIVNKHNLVIDGNGHTVNALGNSRVFGVDKQSNHITFENIVIADGYLYSNAAGAGLYLESDYSQIINCTFINNVANTLTGGTALYGRATHANVTDCRFINNTQEYTTAGALYWTGEDLTIRNTLFENNSADDHAGAILLFDGGDIINCTFAYNSAKYAGATFNYGHANFINCTFIGNEALLDDFSNGGGAVYATNTTMSNCVFTYNKAKMGAAVFVAATSAIVDKCLFINNTATSSNGIICSVVKGGKVVNSIFINNNLSYVNDNVISCIYDAIVTDYNWFGTIWKKNNFNTYKTTPPVSNLASMTKWLFLNATDMEYDVTDGSFKTSFTFMVYDSASGKVINYDDDELPTVNLKLSSQNLTLNKNDANVGDDIDGTTTYYKGSLTAQYENVIYNLPFKFQTESSIVVDSIVNVSKGQSMTLPFSLNPFNDEYLLFLKNAHRLTFESNDTSIVKVTKEGKITGVSAGIAEITIKYNGLNYMGQDVCLPCNATVLINVTPIETHIVFYSSCPTYLEVGNNGNFIVGVKDYKNHSVSGATYSYINNNPEVIKITSSANSVSYQPIDYGVANITIKFDGNDDYLPCSYDLIIDIGRKNSTIRVDTNNLSLIVGKDHYLGAHVVQNFSAELIATSNDTDVATVDADGHVVAVGPGVANLTFKFEGSNRYKPSVTYVLVTVNDIEIFIDVEAEKELRPGDNEPIGAVLRDSNGNSIVVPQVYANQSYIKVYKSNDTSVVNISENGQIYAIKEGIANVTILFKGYREYRPAAANVIVKVSMDKNVITVKPEFELHVGESAKLNATLKYDTKAILKYTSNDTDVVYVNSRGEINARCEGTAKITVAYEGSQAYFPVNETVTVKVVKGTTKITADDLISLHVEDTYNLNANVTSIWENKNISGLKYESSDTKVVKVSRSGVITAVAVGQANITITFAESTKYYGDSLKVPVTVSYVPTVIDVEKTYAIMVGENGTIVASLNPSEAGNLIFTSGDESVVTVDSNGIIAAINDGQANVTVNFKGDKKYASASENVLVTVFSSEIPTTIDVNNTVELLVQDTADIGAKLNPANAGNLTYKSSNDKIVSVDKNGIITAVGVGQANITINFAGENNRFSPSNATVLVKVSAISTTIETESSITINLTENKTIKYTFSHPEAGDIEFIIEDPNIVSINNGVVIANKVGKSNVTIKFKGNDKYLPSNATVLVSVVDVATSIDADDVSVNVTDSASIGAVLTPNVGKLTYTSTNTSVATVSEEGIVTAVKVGETDIVIKFEARGKYAASTKTVHVKVVDVATSIEANDVIVNVSDVASLDAVLTPKVGVLNFTSTNTSIVTVNKNGVVRGISVGEADIIIKFEASGKYAGSTKTVHVKVVNVATSIEASDISVNVTESASIGAVLTPNVGKLNYTSTNTSIVTVNENGLVKGISVGEADIIIKFEAKKIYAASTKTIHVKVTAVTTEITVNDTVSLKIDDIEDLGAIVTSYDAAKLNYTSSNSSVVSVDENGQLTAIAEGSAVINISFAGHGKYLPSNKEVTVDVSRIPTEIRINSTMKTEIGSGLTLKPSIYPVVKNVNYTYTSNDSDVVEAQEKGFIYSANAGTALITINFAGNEKYLPSNATVIITVASRATSIDVESDIEIGFGESKNLNATVVSQFIKNDDFELTYESSDSDIVSVDKNGKITANKIGNATILIKFAGVTSFEPCNATVNVVVTTRTTEVKADKSELSLHVDDESKVTATVINGPLTSALIYTSSDNSVVSVDSNGNVVAHGAGSAVITVRYPGDSEYHSSAVDIPVTVSKFSTKIVSENSYDLKVYETINLNALVNPGEGILSYQSGDNEIASVSSTGIVTGNSVGSAVITIKFAGDRKYLPSQKQVIVNVAKVPTSINLNDITLYSGDEYKLTDILNPSDAVVSSKLFNYESYDWEVFDVDSKGLITAYYEGSAELFVQFKGNDAYLPSNATVTVTVIKKVLSDEDYKFDIDVSDDAGEATFTLTVPDDAEGSLVVTVDGDIYAESVEDGMATLTVDELTPGDHKVTLRYTGDEKYASINNDTTIHIYRIKIDKNKDVSVVYTENAVYTVHLTRDTQAMENKTVTFKVNGNTYYAKTDMLGYASVKLPKLAAKTYTITASYKGIKVTNKIISKHIVVAKNINAKKTKALKVKITLNKVNKKYLAKKKVTLTFQGKKYTAKTNNKGVVTFTIAKSVLAKLKVGKSYTYKVTYSKDTVSKKIKIVK